MPSPPTHVIDMAAPLAFRPAMLRFRHPFLLFVSTAALLVLVMMAPALIEALSR